MSVRAKILFVGAIGTATAVTQLGCDARSARQAPKESVATAPAATPSSSQQAVNTPQSIPPPTPTTPTPQPTPRDPGVSSPQPSTSKAPRPDPEQQPQPQAQPTVPQVVSSQPPAVTASPHSIPQFPWPPPEASAVEVIPGRLLTSRGPLQLLGAVDTVLTAALDQNGYNERSYFAVPEGFAMVTRLEQIESDGSSRRPPGRWSNSAPRLADGFSLSGYFRALFYADPGYYRVIVFIVTDVPFSQAGKSVTELETQEWLRGGLNFLPEWIGTQIYTPQVVCTALIYEFERPPNRDPNILLPSRLNAQSHLVRSGLWGALGGS